MKRSCLILAATCAAVMLSGCVNAAKTITRSTGSTQPSQVSIQQPTQFSAASCSSLGSLSAAHDAPVQNAAFDSGLFDEAVLHFTNQQRCAAGLNPLSADNGLTQAALGHSKDMSQLNFFAHNSPVPGKTKFIDRMRGAGVSFTAAAENLGRNSILSLDSGRPFFVIDRSTCQFSYQQGGAPVAPHSYRSLAKEFVTVWNNSPQHRQNLMGSQYTRLGTGGAFAPNSESCGDIVATQNFAA